MAFPTGWTRRCAVVIDDAQVGSGGVTNFTALLTRGAFPNEACSPTDGNRAQANGGDLRFSSDSAGATQLACCIESWEYDTADAAGDADIRVHVLVPSIAGTGSGDTTIYVWYKAGGSESQPAVDAAFGARAAWDSEHCHVYSLDEAPGGSVPQYADFVSYRAMTVGGSGSTQVAGKHGFAFDGNGTGWANAPFGGFVTPNNAAAVPFTNTGICYVPDFDGFAIVNFDDEEVVEVTKAGVEISRFALTGGPTSSQGIAWNSATQQYAVVSSSGSILYLYQRNGTFDGTVTYSGSGNAVAYDPVDNVYWVSPGSGLDLRSINPTTGATISTVTITGDAAGQAVDGLCYAAGRDTIFWSADAGIIYEINKSTGATIRSFVGPWDIEHLAFDTTDGSLWSCGDARYHSGGTAAGENVVYKLDPDTGQPWDWRSPTTEYSIEWWWKPDSLATGDVISWWAAVKASALYASIQVRSLGAMRVYESDLTYVACPSGTAVVGSLDHWRVTYDAGAVTLTVYKNNTQIAQNTAAVFTPRPDGRFGVGARFNGTILHNGAIDDVRLHSSSRSAAWWTTRYNNTSAPASFASAGTPESASIALDAAITGSASVSGALTTAITAAASVSAAASTTAALTSAITCAGSLSASASATGDLTTAIQCAASVTATASVTADLSSAATLAGSLSTSVTATADLTTAIVLASSVATATTVAADLTTAVTAAGSLSATAGVTGDLTTAIQCAASVNATATTSAALTAGAGMAASVSAAASVAGDLTTSITAAGSVTATATVTGALTTAITCAGSLSAAATVAADLTATAGTLEAALSATATASADLTTAITFAGALSATATCTVALTATPLPTYDTISVGTVRSGLAGASAVRSGQAGASAVRTAYD